MKISILICAFFFSALAFSDPAFTLTRLSKDPYAYHSTEVEPASFGYGSTIVAAFQTGRESGGGATNIGWATSKDGGTTWTNGFLHGTTSEVGGSHNWVSDVYVAYDVKHNVWFLSILASGSRLLIARSLDGGTTWEDPTDIGYDSDGTGIICDNSKASSFFGNCYAFYDWGENVATSSDGGATWSQEVSTGMARMVFPAILPNGTLLAGKHSIVLSKDGGKTWGDSINVTGNINTADIQIRGNTAPNYASDKAGNLYFVWSDCRFRSGCSSNDLAFTMSKDTETWTEPVQINLNLGKSVNYFTPALAVDPDTSGDSAHLAVVYYYMDTNCSGDNCDLFAGFTSSVDGGKTWSSGETLAGPMKLSWLAPSNHVGDYIGISFANGIAFPIFAVGKEPTKGNYDEGMYTFPQRVGK